MNDYDANATEGGDCSGCGKEDCPIDEDGICRECYYEQRILQETENG